jgi:hypothetical protein
MNEDEMSGTRGTYGRDGKCMEVFCGNAERGDHRENQGVDVRILKKWILTKEDRRAWACIRLFREREMWPLLVHTVTNLPFP